MASILSRPKKKDRHYVRLFCLTYTPYWGLYGSATQYDGKTPKNLEGGLVMATASLLITLFLLLVVLAMQFQMRQINHKIDELLKR